MWARTKAVVKALINRLRSSSNRKLSDLGRFIFLLARYVKPYWKTLLVLLGVSLSATVLAAAGPLLMAPILDIALGKPLSATGQPPITLSNLDLSNLGAAAFQLIGGADAFSRIGLVAVLCALYVFVGLLKGLAEFGSYLLALRIRVRAARDLQFDLFRHILAQPLGFFTKQRMGELVSRLERDTYVTTSSLESIVIRLLTAPALIAFYGVLLVRTSPKLVLAALAALLLHYGITRGIQNPIRRAMGGQFTAMADLAARLQETIANIRIVKSFGAEDFELSQLRRRIKEVVRINVQYGVFKHVEEPSRNVINYVIEAGVLLVAASELLSGRLSASTFFLFVYVGRAIIAPVKTLAVALTAIQVTLAASERVFELLSVRSQIRDGSKVVQKFDHQIRFENVTFAYEEVIVLENIDLTIRKGEIVALVGHSGVGKSTLADLILRFYDPSSGCVTVDGRDLRTLQQVAYRRLFGVVSQESLLFNASVRENIAYSREDLIEADIIEAAKVANAHEFIVALPQEYDTHIGDRGVRLSGGQRQRLAIARAVVASPQILILDEATSSLDSESERLVQDAINRVVVGTTAIVIAHRLSTVVHADKIVVLDKGRIVDQGRHGELLQRCELYRHLCQLQFGLEDLPDRQQGTSDLLATMVDAG